VEGFAQMMNDKARVLGLTNTHFENPNGLDSPQHYSTARDLAVLSAYAMKNPIFSKTVSTKTVKIGDRFLRNHNKLLWQLEGAEGVKTGYTKAAGRILVSSAQRQGRRLIAVTINDGDDWRDHSELLSNGFEDYSVQLIVAKGQRLGTVAVMGGDEAYVDVRALCDFSYAITDQEKPYLLLAPPGFAYAPVAENQEAGYAYVCIGEEPVGKIPIIYDRTVEQTVPKKTRFWDRWFGE
jgi:D-alanyl-D-alanine carboxypeptidase